MQIEASLIERIESERKRLGFSMETMARRIGIAYMTYWRWTNRRFNPDLETYQRLHKILDDLQIEGVEISQT